LNKEEIVMAKTKAKRLQSALDKINEGLSELTTIADEVEEARDNMQGTNLENTERYQLYDEAAVTLRQAIDDIETVKGDAEGVEL